jgi:hypothetical protein
LGGGTVLAEAIGFRPEARPYSPHVTLARLNSPAPPDLVEMHLEEHNGFVLPPVPIDRFVLYSSSFVDGKLGELFRRRTPRRFGAPRLCNRQNRQSSIKQAKAAECGADNSRTQFPWSRLRWTKFRSWDNWLE